MYHISDKSAAIREVQRFITGVSQKEESILQSPVDGIYGEETRAAVAEFQRLRSLPVTGSVDRETFDLLFFEYNIFLQGLEDEKNVFDKTSFPLKRGDSGNDVSVLNSLIRELRVYYKDLQEPFGDYFSLKTEESVKLMQSYFIMEEDGAVSIQMFERLKKEIKARKKFRDTK